MTGITLPELMYGITYANKHNSSGRKNVTIHTFVFIGMYKYTDDRGIVKRARKLWRMDDIKTDYIYWYDRKSEVFIPVCKTWNIVDM